MKRTLQALLITGISIFALAPAHAADAPKVTANNYVRAETDVQMKGYIESYNNFGKFTHSRKPYDVERIIITNARLVDRDAASQNIVWFVNMPHLRVEMWIVRSSWIQARF